MYKIWTIAWKDIYVRFTDRNLILIMIATPLALSSIVGLAFGGLGGGDVPIRDIPIALVNHDAGTSDGLNFGQVYLGLLVPGETVSTGAANPLPPCDIASGQPGVPDGQEPDEAISLDALTEAVVFDTEMARSLVESENLPEPGFPADSPAYVDAVARAAVDQGMYTAAVFIPQDFSQSFFVFSEADPTGEPVGMTVYANSGRPISTSIVRSIIEGITNQLLTGNIAIASTMVEVGLTLGADSVEQLQRTDLSQAFACAFSPASNTILLDKQSVDSGEKRSTASAVLVSIGSAQAMFFALFTAQFGVFSMYNERRQWTLQRLVVSPTPRIFIMAGKLLGVFTAVLFQLLLLMLALTLVGSLMEGRLSLIWGSDIPRVGLVLGSASLAVSGMGMLIAGVARTPEQGQVFGTVVNMAMAVLGGAFGFNLPRQISAFSILHWGRNAFDQLAAGQSEIGLNVTILLVQGLVMFLLGIILFNRRFDL